MPGSYVAWRPIGKKIAFVQWAASAASTAGVFFGHGPSSNVSTTSPGRRKSWALKCSNPNCGTLVVSIATTRETPNPVGLPGQEDAAGGALIVAAAGKTFESFTAVTARTDSAGVGGASIGWETHRERMDPDAATHTITISANAATMRRILVALQPQGTPSEIADIVSLSEGSASPRVWQRD